MESPVPMVTCGRIQGFRASTVVSILDDTRMHSRSLLPDMLQSVKIIDFGERRQITELLQNESTA